MRITVKSYGAATLLSALLAFEGRGCAAIEPKMIHEAVTADKVLGPTVYEPTIASNSTTYLGECSPDVPFSFALYGPHGHGAIGVTNAKGLAVSLKDERNFGNVELNKEDGEKKFEPNFFGFGDNIQDDFKGIFFDYYLEKEPFWDEGSEVEVTCAEETEIIVIVNDAYDLNIEATVDEQQDGDEIEFEMEAVSPLKGTARAKKGGGNPVSFESSKPQKKIKIKHDPRGAHKGIALIDGIFKLEGGRKVRRTFIRESKKKQPEFKKARSIPVKCCDLNDEGDIEIDLPGLSKHGETLRADIRLGIDFDLGDDAAHQHWDVVDVHAMLGEGGKIFVDGGWIRKAFKDHDLTWIPDDAFDVVLVDLVVTDPNDAYRVVGVKGNVISNGIPKGQKNKKDKLTQPPSSEEEKVSEDMKVGKRRGGEAKNDKKNLRRLTSSRQKLLVHGYCSGGSPWPEDDFTDATTFLDPDTSPPDTNNNWSHDEFAQKIHRFAVNNGITSCGIIAHSQGGAASLHLYSNYWSCLDAATGGSDDKLIQSLGTPYQGSSLAGSAADLGAVFGVGCDSNTDLTKNGAKGWLAGIPMSAREKVTYYRTQYKDRWWALDYCNLGSSALVDGKDDGATGVNNGVLPGATNGGLTKGQCHTTGMRDPAQYQDSDRNEAMDAAAKY